MSHARTTRCQKPSKVLILGSGALQIGQAGEFDYSGSQAIKALREEGVTTVLINPNIATVQTDKGMADENYFLPVTPYFVEKVLEREQCDALLLSFGGQTALNCGLALEASGVLERLNVRVLGTPVATIRDTEDRHLFAQRLKEINVVCAKSRAVSHADEAVKAALEIGFPVMMRSGFSLGGQGSSIVYDEATCRTIAEAALSVAPQILVEECLLGWKEIEYEVVRDAADNCITVCNMENVDPMGIHTGESIVVAPSQTLDDFEYQMLRDVAIKTIRHLGVVGECNIQYALNPANREYRVIEVNARLSRSSALASKATGYPLAYVAAKIALGYRLYEIQNSVTQSTTAFFEPSLDYIVCKFPRWDLSKFDSAVQRIGSEMKSVGEVMAVGRNFCEALQKAMRMLEIKAVGLDGDHFEFSDLEQALKEATPQRMFAVAKAIQSGMPVAHIAGLTQIDPFFLNEIKTALDLLAQTTSLKSQSLKKLKRLGFSDKHIAKKLGLSESDVREFRHQHNIRPHLAQIDTLAAEFPAQTNFLYLTYSATQSDILPAPKASVLVLGSGCYRIGSSVEFDWCAVSCAKEARRLGYETILLNCNPETVSTDYDTCDRLVFDECTLETVLELVSFEKPEGVFVSVGGQTANSLAVGLARAGVKLIGTSADAIDNAEDRQRFSDMLDRLKIPQPRWAVASGLGDIEVAVRHIGGYPVLLRPSYVLSGASMRVANSDAELELFLGPALKVNPQFPVVISKFETHAREVELDAVAREGEIVLSALTEHIEDAGVHSGDATMVIPPQRLPLDAMRTIQRIGQQLAQALNITGPFNLQTLVKDHEVKVIELNLRASRSFPLVSKTLGVNLVAEATQLMLQKDHKVVPPMPLLERGYVVVKSPQFSFGRIKGADPRLGVEMASTGEVACFGETTEEALLKSALASGFKRPQKGVFVYIEPESADRFAHEAKLLSELNLTLYAFDRTFAELKAMGLAVEHIESVQQAQEKMRSKAIDWVICVPGAARVQVDPSGFHIRRAAADLATPLTTDLWVAKRLSCALHSYPDETLQIKPWSAYLG